MDTSAPVVTRNTKIAIWILRVLMAALFLFAGFAKVTSQLMMVQEFDTVGLGQWFRYLTGLIDLAGGIAVLVPAISGFGAVLLLVVDIGAFVAQIGRIHMDWIYTIVIGVILVALVYLQRDQIRSRLGK